jgi:hypothetical protein
VIDVSQRFIKAHLQLRFDNDQDLHDPLMDSAAAGAAPAFALAPSRG